MAIVIETKRLTLREYETSDEELLHSIVSDAQTMSFYPEPFTQEKTLGWILRAIDTYHSHGYGRYGVSLKGSSELIGCAGFFNAEINGKQGIDLGYLFHRDHWRKGYGVEAARALLAFAAEKGFGKRIAIQMADDHERSWRVAEKLGATLELKFNNPKNRDFLTRLYVIDATQASKP